MSMDSSASRDLISSRISDSAAARLRPRFRRIAVFARSLAATSLSNRFITPTFLRPYPRGDSYSVVASRTADAPEPRDSDWSPWWARVEECTWTAPG